MNHALSSSRSVSLREKVVDYLSLERNVAIASAAVFLLGFGEELWKKFLPKYLEALGASTPIIGLFGTAEDFFDAVYQYPGGWIADHLGRRRAALIFITLSSAGYLVYLFSPWWPLLFVALALVMVTALHSHMLVETPHLFFMHFWANDDAQKLGRGIRAALDKTNSA